MSSYAIERLSADHDRAAFTSGLDSVDRYLRETARGHSEKGVSITRVLVGIDAAPPKPILGFFTLSPILIEAKPWPEAPKGLPNQPVPAILLGRLAVAATHQGKGLGAMLVATACQIATETITLAGGIGLVVDAAHPQAASFYASFGFKAVSPGGLRMFLPAKSLKSGVEIRRE
jgi:GNAT superfamily N-acetyltransferase